MDCNLGSEIGQKMRSAVKAKLLELGTGGSAGFIDDELPDYVMVMVANKRTKQQMNAELNLFLGDQTDLFVTWLHEVLQKLQEVTLPASAGSKKRKSRQAEAPKAKDKDKDRKGRDKKDKRTHRKSGDSEQLNSSAEQTRSAESMPVISSITDVFAEELLEKAKKTLDLDDELLLKKKKRKSTEEDEQPQLVTQETTKELDLPVTSEISSTTSGNREKDIAELAEIQRKIYAAKQHLRQIGELDDESDEDELDDQQLDNDLLNVNEQHETIAKDCMPVTAAAAAPAAEANYSSGTRRAKSPIVFNRTSEPAAAREKPNKTPTEPAVQLQKSSDERSERRSVHERLGCKPISQSQAAAVQSLTPPERSQRSQKELELYVPAHRRRSEQQQPQPNEESKKVERGRERSQRNESQPSRRRERETLRSRRTPSRSRSPEANYKHRIGSRVIVAINKPPEPSDDEDILEKPVNSVIKIKPRPTVSPRRQACKNLLLRAVADAQRSTILAKPTATPSTGVVTSKTQGNGDEPELISSTMGKRRLNDSVGSGAGKELFRRSRRELMVNVLHQESKRMRHSIEPQTELVAKELEEEEEEYVPSLSVGDYETYVPQLVENLDMGMDIDMHVEKSASSLAASSAGLAKTQFVVTLNGDHSLSKAAVAAAAAYRKRSRKRTPSPQVSSTSSTNVQLLSAEPTSTTCASSTNSNNSRDRRTNKSKRARSSSRSSPSTSSNTPPQKPSRSLRRSEVLRQAQEIKKIIIKNDADDDEDEEHQQQQQQMHASPRKRTQKKRLGSNSTNMTLASAFSNTSNELKADSKTQLEEINRSTTPPLPPKRPEKRDISHEKSSISSATAAAAATTLEAPAKAKHTPIRFKLKQEEEQAQKNHRSGSKDRDSSTERRRISIRNAEDRKYDNLPALSAVSVDSTVLKVTKPKERCKYHPNCSKQFCEYYHPSAPCKSFPNCKFADKCMYSHPKCKFDLACMSIDCNFAHSGTRELSHVQLTAPPLSSHVIPVQNYKSISAPATATTATTMCKYYPNCTKVGCTFYHPKPCRYGKNCINKFECIFYHPEMQSKFKWVASLG
ncbi:zinc finger CCCH domain-containing protein 14 isoform X2 [Drosophila grimshawi]|uniref:zinc finger CCCH domain-containing protein 14 isoform X2 n=1 Tax=Drosophila grimshawi TaxID=7222 RepID=UPI000C87058E|nr:zinc finger CCCH domain-containing protein 14 isoform X2 [Drosophila grimshawi]